MNKKKVHAQIQKSYTRQQLPKENHWVMSEIAKWDKCVYNKCVHVEIN